MNFDYFNFFLLFMVLFLSFLLLYLLKHYVGSNTGTRCHFALIPVRQSTHRANFWELVEEKIPVDIGYVSNETNADVRMYIEEFIKVEIWIHCCTKLK